MSQKNQIKFYKSLLGISVFLLVLDRLFGYWVFKMTIYSSNLMVYVSFISLLVLYLLVFSKYKMGKGTAMSIVWIPYFMFTMLGYLFNLTLEGLTYWFICYVILMVAPVSNYSKIYPASLFFWCGMYAIIGVLVQLFFPSFYSSNIAGFFINDRNEGWAEHYGLAGFTYQLDITASFLIYCELALLYMKDKILCKWLNNSLLLNVLLILLIVGVFLTGKRLMAVMAIIIPFLVYIISKKIDEKKILVSFIFVMGSYVLFDYFVTHITEFSDSIVLRRFVESYYMLNEGYDITTSRSYLYDLAWKAFLDNPMLGIGVEQFVPYTRAYTQVHNVYLQVLCEQGIIGFALFVVPVIYCFTYTLKLCRNSNSSESSIILKTSLAFQLYYILYSMTGNTNTGSCYIMYFLSIALAINIEKHRNEGISVVKKLKRA